MKGELEFGERKRERRERKSHDFKKNGKAIDE